MPDGSDIPQELRRARGVRDDLTRRVRDPGKRSGESGQLVSVFQDGATPIPTTTPNQFAVHPVEVQGVERVGVAPTLAVQTGTKFVVTVLNGAAPVANDVLTVVPGTNRWYARKRGTAAAVVETVLLPACPCNVPTTLNMSVVHPEANFGMFQSGVLSYHTVPAELSLLNMGSKAYLSNGTFIDGQTGDSFYYRYFCAGGFFCLSRVYAHSVFGSPFADAIRYRWLGGQPGNTCIPYLMSNGNIFTGGDPASKVTLFP